MGTKKNNRVKSVKELIATITAGGNALKSAGREMGRAVLEVKKFGEAAHRAGSVIDQDIRRGAVDELFAKPDVRVGRGSSRLSPSKRRAESLFDEADPAVETENLTRARRVVENAVKISSASGISVEEAANALNQINSAFPGPTPQAERKASQRPAQAATGDNSGDIKEVRCKIGERQLRQEDDSTGSESDS